ncbi:MAG: V-type ATPase subunit [candidate division KSB1 bacterium]|nr:V-type ATPase subunit [candidate division KSB1 bacterium]
MSSALKKYAFINAKVRARISKMLPDELLDEMIQAKSFLESIEHLKGTPYDTIYAVYSETGDLLTAEKELLKKEIALYLELLNYVDKKTVGFIRALALRYEINNLKNCIRLFFDRFIRERDISSQTPYLIYDNIIHPMNCDRIIYAGSPDELIEGLSGTPYYDIVKSNILRLDKTLTVFPIETALDRFYYDNVIQQISSCLSRKDKEIALRVVYLDIDLDNIGKMIRFKQFYDMDVETAQSHITPYGLVPREPDAFKQMYENEDISDILSALMSKSDKSLKSFFQSDMRERNAKLLFIEKITEQILLYNAQKILSGPPFNIGIILAYFILKKNEIKKIMTILNAKNYNYQPQRISELL